MIGLFLREQASRPPRKVRAAELSCGQVVVALVQEEKLRRNGLPVEMRFGVAGNRKRSGKGASCPPFAIPKAETPQHG